MPTYRRCKKCEKITKVEHEAGKGRVCGECGTPVEPPVKGPYKPVRDFEKDIDYHYQRAEQQGVIGE